MFLKKLNFLYVLGLDWWLIFPQLFLFLYIGAHRNIILTIIIKNAHLSYKTHNNLVYQASLQFVLYLVILCKDYFSFLRPHKNNFNSGKLEFKIKKEFDHFARIYIISIFYIFQFQSVGCSSTMFLILCIGVQSNASLGIIIKNLE